LQPASAERIAGEMMMVSSSALARKPAPVAVVK
jgi:hypothetical protein